MTSNLPGLLAKTWKDEPIDLAPGKYPVHEQLLVTIDGTVEKREDQLVTPTVSIPLIPTLAFLLRRMGGTRARSLAVLAAAISDAMASDAAVGSAIKDETKEVEAVIAGIKEGLLAKLPKAARGGAVITKGLDVTYTVVPQQTLAAVAA